MVQAVAINHCEVLQPRFYFLLHNTQEINLLCTFYMLVYTEEGIKNIFHLIWNNIYIMKVTSLV